MKSDLITLMPSKNFAAVILILLTGIALQFVFGENFGIWINFSFAALVAAAIFFDPLRLLFLALLAVFMLNWRPAFSWELIFIAAPPFLVFQLRETFPWRRWLSATIFTFAGIVAIYAIFAPKFILAAPQIFAIDALTSALFAAAAFKTIKIMAQ